MAKRYVYNKYEAEMIDNFNKTADSLPGVVENLHVNRAEELHVKDFATWVDPWNPLWNDEEYAKKTRWGGIIAPPVYVDCAATFTFFPSIDPRGGFVSHNFYGEDWEFFKPVYIGDRFKVVRKRPQLDDITALDGSDELHTFSIYI